MAKTLRIGVVGCGRIAFSTHLPCYRHIPNSKVVAVMDTVPQKATYAATTFGVKKIYYDYLTMLKDDEIDAVDICSPPAFHAENARLAAEMGKHMFCEKPIATSLEEGRDLMPKLKKAGVHFMTGFTYRFHPLIEKMRSSIDNPSFLRISYSFHPEVKPDDWVYSFVKNYGFIVEQAVHWFDLFSWWAGDAKKVFAKINPNEEYQNTVVITSYENNSLGLIDFNTNSSFNFFSFVVENANKSAVLRLNLLPSKWGGSLLIKERNKISKNYFLGHWGLKQTCRKVHYPISFFESKIIDSSLVPFHRELSHFVNSVLSDKTPIVSSLEGLNALKIACKAKESGLLRKELPID
jgi:UDP-N-acetylglucosamine 3-dehydrogenase